MRPAAVITGVGNLHSSAFAFHQELDRHKPNNPRLEAGGFYQCELEATTDFPLHHVFPILTLAHSDGRGKSEGSWPSGRLKPDPHPYPLPQSGRGKTRSEASRNIHRLKHALINFEGVKDFNHPRAIHQLVFATPLATGNFRCSQPLMPSGMIAILR